MECGEGWNVDFTYQHIRAILVPPDGLVYFDGKMCGCIEIKCPYSAREKLVSDACLKSQFFTSDTLLGVV